MNVCMVAYSFYETDNRVRRYAETLTRCGYNVDVIALAQKGEPLSPRVLNGVRIYPIQHRTKDEKGKLTYFLRLLAFFVRSISVLTKMHIRQKYVLVHVHSIPDFEVFAALYPKLTGSKIILDIHDIVPELYTSKFAVSTKSLVFKALVKIERISGRFADHVIAANHIWQKRLIQRSVPEGKITTILNFPDPNLFHPCERTRENSKFVILYPGSLNHHQGLDIAVRGFKRIASEFPQAELHIYGSGGDYESLKTLIADSGLQKRVFLRGFVPLDEVAQVIENADLGVVPKRKSGFGNEAFSTKILEFMTMGVPVVVSNTEIDKYYFPENTVKFFESEDEDSLAEAFRVVISKPEFRSYITQNARKFVRDYSWDANQTIYTDLVEKLVGTPTRELGPVAK